MGIVGGEKVLSAQILIREGSPPEAQEGSKRPDSQTEITRTPEEDESGSVPKSK